MDKKLLLWSAAALDAAIFFLIAFSSLSDIPKFIACLVVLAAGGMYLASQTGWESYLGINLARGKSGIGLMHRLGKKHPALFRNLADLGAALGYGIPFSFYAYKTRKKFLAVAIAACILMSALLAAANSQDPAQFYNSPGALAIFVIGLLGGVALQSVGMLALSIIRILTVPGAPAGAQLLIVGVTVPWEWIFGLVIAATIHEFAHGVLSSAEGIKITSAGAILFGFLPLGAFVEPDEAEFKKLKIAQKRRILAAGPTANIIGFFLFSALLLACVPFATPAIQSFSQVTVFSVNSSYQNQLVKGDVLRTVGGNPVNGLTPLYDAVKSSKPGDHLAFITDSGPKDAVVGADGKLGILLGVSAKPGSELMYYLLSFLLVFLSSTAYLNLAIGSINLVPLFITDGGRIVSEEFGDYFISKLGKKRGKKFAVRASMATSAIALALVLANLLLPPFLRFLPTVMGFVS